MMKTIDSDKITYTVDRHGTVEIYEMNGSPIAAFYPLDVVDNASGIPNERYNEIEPEAELPLRAVYRLLKDMFDLGILKAREIMLYEAGIPKRMLCFDTGF